MKLSVSSRRVIPVCMVAVLIITSIGLSGAAAQDAVTIEWWSVSSEEYSEDVQRALVDAFEAEHPNINVNLTILPESGFTDKMTTTLGAGQGAPDVAFFWDTNWYPQALDLTPGVLQANTLTKAADSLPAMVGALCGARQGVSAIGVLWRERLATVRGVCLPFLAGAKLEDLTRQLFEKRVK